MSVMNAEKKKLHIIFAGGGTGGHLFPAIAIYESISKKSTQKDFELKTLFIGSKSGVERSVLPELNLPTTYIPIKGFQRHFNIKNLLKNLILPLRILSSYFKCFFIFLKFKPDVVIGTGSYVSAIPLMVARHLKIPFFLQEQNVIPGWVTKYFSESAVTVFTSFQETSRYIKNTTYTGIPLRESLREIEKDEAANFFELDKDRKTIFIFGGSQGSIAINRYWETNILSYIDTLNCQFIWQTGIKDYFRLKEKFNGNDRIRLTPFIHEIEYAYSAADIVICRAGALTLAELSFFGKPSILIPLPIAAENHQEVNARLFEKINAARVVLQSELAGSKLFETISKIINDDNLLVEMGNNARKLYISSASNKIAESIIKYAEKNVWED